MRSVGSPPTPCGRRSSADPAPAPVVADLAAGPAPYVFDALAASPRARAILCDIDPAALEQARRRDGEGAHRSGAVRAGAARSNATGWPGSDPGPSTVIELGPVRHLPRRRTDPAPLRRPGRARAPEQIVFNVQTQNPEIEHIARVWRDHRGERCVWRLRPLEMILQWAAAAGYEPATIRADRHGIYRVVRLARDRRRRNVSVLTWTENRPIELAVSERLRRVAASHHGMWNYVTYRDAIGLLGLDPG